jgi:hypothetical protein
VHGSGAVWSVCEVAVEENYAGFMTQTIPTPQAFTTATTKTNTLAIISLVTSILWGTALVGIITGHIAMSQIKRTGESGRGLALAGVIIGYAGIVFAFLGLVAWWMLVVSLSGLRNL